MTPAASNDFEVHDPDDGSGDTVAGITSEIGVDTSGEPMLVVGNKYVVAEDTIERQSAEAGAGAYERTVSMGAALPYAAAALMHADLMQIASQVARPVFWDGAPLIWFAGKG